jgi:hypothetical protein
VSGIDSKQAGLWVPPGAPYCGQASVQGIANRGWVCRFACPKSQTITKIAFFVTIAATADDPCDVGIYDGLGSPLNRLGSSGSVSGLLNSTGRKEVPLSAGVPLTEGKIYYAAFAYGTPGGTPANLQMVAVLHVAVPTLFGTQFPYIEHAYNNAMFPLPTTFTVPGQTGNCVILALLQ